MPETPPQPPTGGHLPPERLRAFLADDLPEPDAQAAAEHLETCATCMVALDHLAAAVAATNHPEDSGAPTMSTSTLLREGQPAEIPVWDERRMRRSVRRTLLGIAARAALMLVLAALVIQILGWFVIHPLAVDRGERLPRAIAATFDLPVLTIPGAEIVAVNTQVGIVRRSIDVDVQRAVGGTMEPLGRFSTRLGPFGMSTPDGAPVGIFPILTGPAETGEYSRMPFEAGRLGEGTATTVELVWLGGRSIADIETVIEGDRDTSLLWVGFGIPGGHPSDPAWRLGYSACGQVPDFMLEQTSGSFGTDGGFRIFGGDTGARHALDETRRAIANLAATDLVGDAADEWGALADPAGSASYLADNEPEVASVVIAGPTPAVEQVIDAAEPDETNLLGVDFDRGPPGECG